MGDALNFLGLNRRGLLAGAAVIALSASVPSAAALAAGEAKEPIPVVATFSILADMVREVGGKRVSVVSLIAPGSDAHVFRPTPADVRDVSGARLVVSNGLGFEGWLERLFNIAGFEGRRVVVSKGLEVNQSLIASDGGGHDHGHGAHGEHRDHSHGDGHHDSHGHGDGQDGARHKAVDPHAWQDVQNAILYVRQIEAGLCAADPAGCDQYKANAKAYIGRLEALDAEIKALFADIPKARRRIVTSHDAFRYFARAYGIEIHAAEGLATDEEASAKAIAGLIRTIRAEGIRALFVENVSDPRLIAQIGRETGLKPVGTLYSDALSRSDGPAGSYVEMMKWNATAIANELR